MARETMLRYNERSWAIDLISYINLTILPDKFIKRASGELTLKAEKNLLFPDVLLYGDKSTGRLLQGWELKMPDTSINDQEFISNAEKKARSLGLNSFVVWNVSIAVLYILNEKINIYELYEEPLYANNAIVSREDVVNHPDLWKSGADEILEKLNRYFEGGLISGVAPEIMFSDSGIVEQLLTCQLEVKRYIEEKMKKDSGIDAKIKVWWRHVKLEYPGERSPAGPLAYHILLRWFNRFIFSNILKAYTDSVSKLEGITEETTLEEALNLFEDISIKSDFANVFHRIDFDYLIPESVWDTFIDINEFLKEFQFSQIDRAILQSVLKATILTTIKKTAGLYVTPEKLADLLVFLTLDDKTGIAIDPFCGTGTIVNSILSVKCNYNISGRVAIESTWGCDKFAFPVQIAALAISAPENMNVPLRIFTHDAFKLEAGQKILFIDPSTGDQKKIEIPLFSAIISNLPFVQFEDLNTLNPVAFEKIEYFYSKHNIPNAEQLSGRSDLYAYIPFLIYDILDKNGHIGIIVSNSWLATEWGKLFRDLLSRFYSIKCVVTSANGRWFHNTDVVTNLLVCQKGKSTSNSKISFISILKNIYLSDIDNIASDIITNTNSSNIITNKISLSDIKKLDDLSIGWMSCFSNVEWFLSNKEKFKLLGNYNITVARGGASRLESNVLSLS